MPPGAGRSPGRWGGWGAAGCEASRLPWVGNGPLNDVRARRGAAQYWQRDYAALVPKESDPVAAISADNIELQRLVANAVYRMGQVQSTDKEKTLAAIDASLNAY